MGGGADKPIDGWANIQMYRQTDRQRDSDMNEQGWTDGPSYSDWVTQKDDSMDLFDLL